MRALLLVAALVVGGCGDDTTSAGAVDMSQPVLDLAHHGLMCGISTCNGDCSGCVMFGGGVCVPPCMTSDPNSCTAPAMCRPLGGGGGADGGGGAATLVGSCSGFDGYCG